MPASHEDAQLIVQLLRWNNESGGDKAMRTILAADFDPETADLDTEGVHQVLMLGETVGTFVKHNVLNRELLVDLLWIDGLWAKVGPAARRAREHAGEPRLFENFEALAR
jgi:hypothetical protein